MIIQAGLTLIIMFNWEKNKFFLQLSLVSKSHCVLSCVFCLFLHSICWRTNPLRPAEVLGNIDHWCILVGATAGGNVRSTGSSL